MISQISSFCLRALYCLRQKHHGGGGRTAAPGAKHPGGSCARRARRLTPPSEFGGVWCKCYAPPTWSSRSQAMKFCQSARAAAALGPSLTLASQQSMAHTDLTGGGAQLSTVRCLQRLCSSPTCSGRGQGRVLTQHRCSGGARPCILPKQVRVTAGEAWGAGGWGHWARGGDTGLRHVMYKSGDFSTSSPCTLLPETCFLLVTY